MTHVTVYKTRRDRVTKETVMKGGDTTIVDGVPTSSILTRGLGVKRRGMRDED